MDLDDLVMSKKHDKVSHIQANTKLGQLDKHQTGMAETPSSISTGGNILLLITARKRSLGQGNIFAPVCHSVHGRRVPGPGGA